jgi:hypothetical protein
MLTLAELKRYAEILDKHIVAYEKQGRPDPIYLAEQKARLVEVEAAIKRWN